jgi:glycoprotein-N-acetylgalactosamine 3-beta-galactosyltransferase
LERQFLPKKEQKASSLSQMKVIKRDTGRQGGLFYTPGGGGYVFSWPYLKHLADVLKNKDCIQGLLLPDDWAIHFCMYFEHVVPSDTRDQEKRERFHQYSPAKVYWEEHDETRFNHQVYQSIYQENNFFSDHAHDGWRNREGCCAPDSISFHYMDPLLMEHAYRFYYPEEILSI